MKKQEITALVDRQRIFFRSGATLEIEARIHLLILLQALIVNHEKDIIAALHEDLGKSATESIMCEIGMVKSALSHMLKHIRKYAKTRRVATPLAQFAARSVSKPAPYGVALIMSPWNYPFLLSMEPLIEAVAAGNTVILKPSAYAPHTSAFLQDLFMKHLDNRWMAMVSGGRKENTALLDCDFDIIFFTGSQRVGKEVMRRAAEHLTPVTLELGGKSPCIVEATANLELAAKRIVFGKFLNCGQTCVAPDYIYCDESIREPLIEALEKEIVNQYGEKPLENPDYGRMINKKHFDRVCALIDAEKVRVGGDYNEETLQIAPTVMSDVSFVDAVMEQEIFGPVLPILTYSSIESAVRKLNMLPHPLALYIFTERANLAQKVMNHCQFGGGCVNDTIIHLASNRLGFGGVGASGMGSYHGEDGFRTFSHYKSIVDKKTWMDLPMRYQPYTSMHEKMIRRFMK